MSPSLAFALNQLAVPGLPLADFLDLAVAIKGECIELNTPIEGGLPPDRVSELCRRKGLRVLSLGVLSSFDVWSDARRAQALKLAADARDCGAEALVLRPLNDLADPRSRAERVRGLRTALTALAPLLREYGLLGFVEPLGFESSALRHKRDAVEAIKGIGGLDVFRLVHDTVHHRLAGEQAFFPELTGVVRAPGGEAPRLAPDDLADAAGQIHRLLASGFRGPFSFGPLPAQDEIQPPVQERMRYLLAHLEVIGEHAA